VRALIVVASRPLSSPLVVVAVVLAVLAAVPVLSVASSLFAGGTGAVWAHLIETVLADYVVNTLLLLVLVGAGVIAVGVGSAWLVTMLEFPGRRVFEWMLVLPLAMPAYVMAYAYTDLLQFTGPVQTALREATGWSRHDYWFPEVRSLGGAALMFVFVLYPYVYLLARSAFIERSGNVVEVSRSLGYGPWASFLRLSLPLARPAIAGGVALALMETLADYGTVSYFAVQTFTTGIYRAWLSMGDRLAASQLACALLTFVVLVLALERLSRGRASYATIGARARPIMPLPLRRGWAALAVAACLVPIGIGFALPAATLINLAIEAHTAHSVARYLQLTANSFLLAGITSMLAVAVAVALAYAVRLHRGPVTVAASRMVSLGYAIPGAVLAVGILIPLAAFDNALDALMRERFGIATGLLVTGTVAALIYAYLVRFMAVAMESVDNGLAKITPSMDDAARSLGLGSAATLWQVHRPLMQASVLTAALLVFVDVMKELPATLVIRPFNFDTLATQAYTYAADERLGQAAVASLVIVAVGVLPVMLLTRPMRRQRSAAGGERAAPAAGVSRA
jgi:iron(III) transport system permease protein